MNSSRSMIRQAARSVGAIPGPSRPSLPCSPIGQTRAYNPFDTLTSFLTSPRKSSKKKNTILPSSTSSPSLESIDDLSKPPTEESTPRAQEGNLFDQLSAEMPTQKKVWNDHKYSTASFKMSHRKLNDLARQISGRPIDDAILQMQFSEKRAGKGRIKSTLALAKNHAVDKGLNGGRLVVAESWVSKGQTIKRIDIKGRARHGIKEHRQARLHVVLREGLTKAELKDKKREKVLGLIRSAGVVREEKKLINWPTNAWRW